MLKDGCTVAIFDVDGTLVNGNCSRIFIDFLSLKSIITPESTSKYRYLIKQHETGQENILKIAKEAFSILSGINPELLVKSWNVCFNEEIIPRINRYLIEIIKSYQYQNKPVFLASGSPGILVKSIAEYLSISASNIIASSIANSNGAASNNGKVRYCIGSEKVAAISSLFKQRKLSLKQACFYTDNFTDIPMLKQVGEGYWAGSDMGFERNQLADFGIKRLFNDQKEILLQRRSNNILDEYYRRHRDVIESAITCIFPVKCQQTMLDDMIGNTYANWDLATIQKAFFDPVNVYLSSYDHRLLTIGVCIFLEAAGVELKDHDPLLGIPELLNISNEVFIDITNWTSNDMQHQCDRSHLEISILGNASISLLSLPVHNIIHNRIQLCPETRLRIYEMYTSIVYKSLLGNGIRLYWQEHDEYAVSYDEYVSVSKLLNGGLFQFGINLFQILHNTKFNTSTLSAFLTYMQNAAALVQLMRDDLSYKCWRDGIYEHRKYSFNRNTNLIGIHACKTSSYAHVVQEFSDQEDLIDKINQVGSVEFLNNLIEEYTEKVAINIDALPFNDKYKKLIENYTHELVHL